MSKIYLKGKYMDSRNGRLYNDVICRAKDARWFVKVEE